MSENTKPPRRGPLAEDLRVRLLEWMRGRKKDEIEDFFRVSHLTLLRAACGQGVHMSTRTLIERALRDADNA